MMTIRSAKFVLSLDRLHAFPGQGIDVYKRQALYRADELWLGSGG